MVDSWTIMGIPMYTNVLILHGCLKYYLYHQIHQGTKSKMSPAKVQLALKHMISIEIPLEEIRRSPVEGKVNYFIGFFYIPGGAGFQPSTASNDKNGFCCKQQSSKQNDLSLNTPRAKLLRGFRSLDLKHISDSGIVARIHKSSVHGPSSIPSFVFHFRRFQANNAYIQYNTYIFI